MSNPCLASFVSTFQSGAHRVLPLPIPPYPYDSRLPRHLLLNLRQEFCSIILSPYRASIYPRILQCGPTLSNHMAQFPKLGVYSLLSPKIIELHSLSPNQFKLPKPLFKSFDIQLLSKNQLGGWFCKENNFQGYSLSFLGTQRSISGLS